MPSWAPRATLTHPDPPAHGHAGGGSPGHLPSRAGVRPHCTSQITGWAQLRAAHRTPPTRMPATASSADMN